MSSRDGVFVCFEPDDALALDELPSGLSGSNVPWAASEREGRFEAAWAERTRAQLRRAVFVVVLVTPNTARSAQVAWELRVAREEATPVFGLRVGPEGGLLPAELDEERVLSWTQWHHVAVIVRQLDALLGVE